MAPGIIPQPQVKWMVVWAVVSAIAGIFLCLTSSLPRVTDAHRCAQLCVKKEPLVPTKTAANVNNQKSPSVLFPCTSPDPFKGRDKVLQLVPLRALC